jgi:hypothetical protein
MAIKHRPKASGVTRKRPHLAYGQPIPFESAFPEIEGVEVEVIERGAGILDPEPILLKKQFLGEFIDCHNPICFNGGFSIGRILRQMILENKTELESKVLCKGHEGSPGGHNIYRKCLNSFAVRVRINYKN